MSHYEPLWKSIWRSSLVPSPPDWSQNLISVGVTGTDGKTSTVAILAAALETLRAPVARVTSQGAYLGNTPLEVPRSYHGLTATMRSALESGGRYGVVEWASWSLANGYLDSWPVCLGIVTNVTRDHLDYHGSFEAYLDSKARLVEGISLRGTAVLNGDDVFASSLGSRARSDVRVIRYGYENSNQTAPWDVSLSNVKLDWFGTRFRIGTRSGCGLEVRIPMIGRHFAENATAAFAAATALGVDPHRAAAAMRAVQSPPGRFEVVAQNPHVVIDFAHTPNAMERTIQTARTLCLGNLSVVFGAGGERDVGKRPLLGHAARAADRVLITSDNPRGEDPRKIIDEIRAGTSPRLLVESYVDRRQAIRAAVAEATADDVVLISGRGRDTHSHIAGSWIPMDDAAIALSCHPRGLADSSGN